VVALLGTLKESRGPIPEAWHVDALHLVDEPLKALNHVRRGRMLQLCKQHLSPSAKREAREQSQQRGRLCWQAKAFLSLHAVALVSSQPPPRRRMALNRAHTSK